MSCFQIIAKRTAYKVRNVLRQCSFQLLCYHETVPMDHNITQQQQTILKKACDRRNGTASLLAELKREYIVTSIWNKDNF